MKILLIAFLILLGSFAFGVIAGSVLHWSGEDVPEPPEKPDPAWLLEQDRLRKGK